MTKQKRIKKSHTMEESSVSSTCSLNSSTNEEECPGPMGLPLVGSMLEWEGPHTNLTWTKKFGPIYQVQMGPKTLIYLNNIGLVEKYMEGRAGEKYLDRPMGPAVIGEGLLFGSGDLWRKNKKAFMTALHTSTFFDHMEGSIQSELKIALAAMMDNCNKTIKIGDILLPAVSNSIAGLLLGGTLPPDSQDRKQLGKVGRDLEGVDLNSMRTKIALKFPWLREPMSKLLFKEIVDFHGISRRLQRLLRQWIRQCRNGTLTPSQVSFTASQPALPDCSRLNDTKPRKLRVRIPADDLLSEDSFDSQDTEQTEQPKSEVDNVSDDGRQTCCPFISNKNNSHNSSNEGNVEGSSETLASSSSNESLLTSFRDDDAIDRAIRCSTYYSAYGFSEISRAESSYERSEPLKFETPVTPLTEFQWNFTSRASINVKEDSILKRIINQPEFTTISEENDQDMVQALMDMFFGGISPVLSSLEFILFYLTCNPGMQDLAREEVDKLGGDITWTMHDVMPYIRACITEGLRMGSVTPSTLPHVATEDTEIEGFHVPKDTMVMGSIFSLHFDPKHYLDPEYFRPQRHLNIKGNFEKPESFRPFGVGGRRCVGEKMAEMQLFLFLTHILRHFVILPPLGKKTANKETHVRITRRLKDFRCVLQPRDKTH